MAEPLLTMAGISKSFPGVKALSSVDFNVNAGEVHALMGENGAGKSTLIKVMTGVFPMDSGRIELMGRSIHPRSPLHAQALGISTVYQEVNLIPSLSVAENICLGREPRGAVGIRWREVKRIGQAALERLDVRLDVDRLLSSYSIAIQQMVAIARAVDIDAKVLVLDEPTSSLDAEEVSQLFVTIRKLKAEGMGIVFVSHFLEQVFEISDRVTILRNGALIGVFQTPELTRSSLVAKMVGKELADSSRTRSHQTPATSDESILAVNDLGKTQSVTGINLELRQREVVGLAGLLGSGRTETAQLIFGIDQPDRGSIRYKGKATRMTSPRKAIRLGLGFLSEDRKVGGIIPNLSVRENIVLALQANRGCTRPLSRKRQEELANKYIAALRIATPDADKPIGQLSGGNQQKVLIARWLASQPEILILDEPTRGIDVGAKAEIEGLVRQLCDDGMAIMFISSEMDELLRTSHRVVVLRDRRQIGELAGDRLTQENLIKTIAAGADAN